MKTRESLRLTIISEQLESAVENYEKALKIDPKLEMASTNLEYLKGYQKRQKEQQESAGSMTLEQSPQETPDNMFEPPAEEAPAFEEAPAEEASPWEMPKRSFYSAL